MSRLRSLSAFAVASDKSRIRCNVVAEGASAEDIVCASAAFGFGFASSEGCCCFFWFFWGWGCEGDGDGDEGRREDKAETLTEG